MLKTLKYFFEVKGNNLEKANGGIGIVPFVYEDARRYWHDLWITQKMNKRLMEETHIDAIPVKEIHICSPQRKPMKHFRELFAFLDEEGEEIGGEK